MVEIVEYLGGFVLTLALFVVGHAVADVFDRAVKIDRALRHAVRLVDENYVRLAENWKSALVFEPLGAVATCARAIARTEGGASGRSLAEQQIYVAFDTAALVHLARWRRLLLRAIGAGVVAVAIAVLAVCADEAAVFCCAFSGSIVAAAAVVAARSGHPKRALARARAEVVPLVIAAALG